MDPRLRLLTLLVAAADLVAFALLLATPVVAIAVAARSRPGRVAVRIAYLGYAACAAIAADLALHLAVEGGEILKAGVAFAAAFVVEAALASVMTFVGARAAALRGLFAATLAVALAHLAAGLLRYPGPTLSALAVIDLLYAAAVVATVMRGRRDWWRAPP
ncbi:MAG: hypothetical protein JSR54_11830 [Proteobacteria bacterium]|nr:hypothetical protein [Pseudomonadota bacterium]